MVTFENKSTNLNKISEALENNLNIIPADSRLKTIVDEIADNRYTFKLLGETETLSIASERPSLLYKKWLYVGGGEALGNALVIIDTDTMQIIKQITLAEGVNIVNTFNIVSDGTYWYIGTNTGHIIKGNLETGEVVLSQYNASFGATYNLCVDNDYLYTCGSNNKLYKIDKNDLSIVATSVWSYTTPIALICKDDYLYMGGTGRVDDSNSQAIVKILKSDLSIVNTSVAVGGQVRDLIFIDDYIYSAAADGGVKKWLLGDLTFISTIYQHTTLVRTLRYKLGDFWLGDNLGCTLRVNDSGQLLATLSSLEASSNYILEIDESNQMLYRNSSIDTTVTKYQIIDNLQNNTSTTVIKTADLITLNTTGMWVDTVYTLNGMDMTCVTLDNGHLRQLSFSGTTTADSEFVLAVPNVNNKLTPNTSYILNGVKSTDSSSTVFIRLTQYQNSDGSGLSKITEKVAGDFKVFIAANDDYLYYKIEIVIKSGVTLTNSLYNNIPSIVPSSITYKQGEGPYLIKDLSTITDSISCNKLEIIDGRLFVLPNNASAGTIEVRDYQSNALLKTINDEANVGATGICFDADYIYIAKCVETITDKKYRDVYVRKYNRCTLDFISESSVLYTGVSGTLSTNSANIFAMVENDEHLYLAGVHAGYSHSVRKIKKSDFSQVSEITWHIPLNIIKYTNGFFVLGINDNPKFRCIDFLDWNLNIIQTFPQTSLTNNNFRKGFYKDDYLFAGNDSGVLVKYQISTNTIVAETQISEAAIIRNIVLINDNCILLQTNTGKIMLYDLNLNFIKMWDFYNTSTTSGYIIDDNNNTIWTQSASQPTTIYKKQFIDMTSDII